MNKWLIMLCVGLGIAATALLQKHQLNRGVNWPSVALSHTVGCWCTIVIILMYVLVTGRNQISLDPFTFIGGLIAGVTTALAIWFLTKHSTSETTIGIRATAAISVLFLSYFLLRETPTGKQWIGFGLILIGTFFL